MASDVEIADIRLRAWALLKGWGNTDDGKFTPWNYGDLKIKCDDLTRWALSPLPVACDFCGAPKEEVKHLLSAETGAMICDSCVPIAADQIRELSAKETAPE